MRFAPVHVFVLLAPLLALAPARAEEVPPAREAALAAWLADDDATALPALAALAREGDVPSALFLAAIELRQPDSAYRMGLSPTEKRDILRAPGSAFGTPWTEVVPEEAAPDTILALRALRARDWDVAISAALAAGETGIARLAVLALAEESPPDLFDLDLSEPLPGYLRPVLWSTAIWWAGMSGSDQDVRRLLDELAAAPDGLARRVAASNALGGTAETIDPHQAALGRLLRSGAAPSGADAALVAEAAAYLAAAPEAQPARDLCAANCPGDLDGCLVAANTAARGYATLFALDTPLAAAIPTERFRASPRAQADLLRLSRGSAALLSLLPATPGGSCLARLIPAP